MLWLSFIWIVISSRPTAAFEVLTSASHLVVVRGKPAKLDCRFPPDPGSDIGHLVVTWQRQDDSTVVHSFYYGEDQLDLQGPGYRNRTCFFQSELNKGNASLQILGVGPNDAGVYLCSISTLRGIGTATIQLEYAAFYAEPRLRIHLNPPNIRVSYETEGYPPAEVQWEGLGGQKLVHNTHTSPWPEDAGLLFLKSEVTVEDNCSPLQLSFRLINRPVSQQLERTFNLQHGICRVEDTQTKTITFLSVSVGLLLVLLCLVMVRYCSQRRFFLHA